MAVSAADIVKAARGFSVSIDPATAERLAQYCALLLTWDRQINLGGAHLAEELVPRHLADCFVATPFIPPEGRLVDVGSGGGLPALPLLLLVPGVSGDLFEVRAKKAAFLRTAVRELGIGGRGRVHTQKLLPPLAPDLAGAFDVATSRATLAPAQWLSLGRSLVHGRGRVMVFATGHENPALPPASHELGYGPDRRLLVYDSVPRGT